MVDGFTIQGGYGLDDLDGYSVGSGIKCDSSSSPKIINNTISGNGTHSGYGGGISCWYSSPTINNNTDGDGDACEDFECGDANCDLQVNVGDAVYLISHIFKGGPAPTDTPCP